MATNTMKAAAVHRFGEALTVVELPIPQPRAGEVLIKVAAASVNPADLGMRDGRYSWTEPVRFPLVPGYDIAGTVAALGEGAELAIGDAVIANTVHKQTQVGGYAEYVALPAAYVAPAPKGADPVLASTLPLPGLTAAQVLDVLALTPGQTLYVNGPRGSVGAYAIQLAKHAGINTVTAEDEPAPGSLDVVGAERAHAAFATVVDGGRYATIVPEFWVPGGPFTPARGITPETMRFQPPKAGDLAALSTLVDQGVLALSPVARTFPLAKANDALATLAGGVRGKIVITMD